MIVAMVCSAGGLDALRHILAPLPADFPAAVVVLRHVRPGTPPMLANILARSCRLPVRSAADGDPLAPGTVLVVPPGTHALARMDGTIALIASDGPPPYRPSADLLLSSLAVTAGPRVIAVVLSGGGNDGATGAVAVHDLGGTVIAADQESSEHFEMPSAAIGRDNAVDHVLPVNDIAGMLVSLCPPAVGPDGRSVREACPS
jgi:two-component system, chemotaxis family, protein-glutamate methylesterase/glutaminase